MTDGPDRTIDKLRNVLRVLYHWRRRSLVLPYEPAEIGIELTNRCNFKCAFCVQSDPDHFKRSPPTAITPERVERILENLRRGGVKTHMMHWTLDGEPFMNKRFAEVVRVATRYGFNTHHFASNGFFLTPERLREFPRGGQRYYVPPDFCSDEEFFETYRGTPGSWTVVRDNLCAVLRDPQLDHFHFKIHDISAFKIHDSAELDARFEALKALFPASSRVSFHRRIFHNMTGYLELEKQRGRYRVCPYPWSSLTIASNGDAVACCRDLERQTILGNLFEQEFAEIWNGERYRALRRDLAEGRPERQRACNGCDMPWDSTRFSARNWVKSAVHRLVLFERRRGG